MPSRFTFKVNAHERFKCTIKTQRCNFVKRNGQRCRCKVVIGTPLCYTHLLHEKHLRIKQSTVPQSGKGLFALLPAAAGEGNEIVFRKGDTIVDYTGELVTEATVSRRYGADNTAPYTIQVGRDAFIDAACRRGAGSIANTSAANNNATFSTNPRNRTAKLVATKTIRNGSEVFVSYGRQYVLHDENATHSTKPLRSVI